LQLWSSAASKLKEHNTQSEVHKTAVLKASEFLKNQDGRGDIMQQLSSSYKSQRAENRLKLISIIKCIIFCGKQNLALRGHYEQSSTIKNSGNFLELLKFRAESGDVILQNHLKFAPKNATYKSAPIQNEIIAIIGKWIQRKILISLNQGSSYFAILADEARDSSNKEQMPIIIRYTVIAS
jgi:hypothetical protein